MRLNALFLLLLFSFTALSQDCAYTLSGYVVDLHDGSRLSGATLELVDTDRSVQADLDGEYFIDGLCNGSYTVQVSHPSCLTQEFKVKVSNNTVRVFRLEHHLNELNEVTLQGKAYSVKSQTLVDNSLSQDELERYTGGSLGDALNSLSGVSSLNTGNTVVKPMINGLHSSRVLVINNGVRMEDQEWGAEHAPNIDINTVGHLVLIKGAGALQFGGDAVGGVVVAEPRRIPVKDSLYGRTLMSAASNGRGGTLTSELTKSFQSGWYATLQGTIKRFGDFEAPDYVLSNTGIFERSGSVRLGLNRFGYGLEGYYSYFRNDIGILRASHLGGAEDQVRAINRERPLIVRDFTYDIGSPRQEVEHHLARIKAFKRFDNFGKLSLQYDFQRNNRFEFDTRRGDDADKASVDLELDTHTLMLDLQNQESSAIGLKTGIMARYQTNFPNPDTGVRRLIPDYDSYDLGIYGILDYELQNKWLFELGARFDYSYMDVFKFYRNSFWESRGYDERFPEIVIREEAGDVLTNPQLNFYNGSATAGVTYQFDERYTLFFNYSLASRAPNPSELFSEGLHHSASRIELGDLSFNSEVAHKLSLAFQRNHEGFGFSINPYINTINGFIVIEPTGVQQTTRGHFQVWEYRQTNAQLLGVDIDASLTLTENFDLTHQTSFVKGYDREFDLPLINIPAVNTVNGLVYHNEKANNLNLKLQSTYVFRQNEFPNTNFEIFIPETETLEEVDVSTPPDAYHLLDFDSSMDFKLSPESVLTLGVGVKNLLNTSYRNYLNRLRLYADDLGRNFLLNLKINY